VREQITLGIADAMHDGDAFRGIRDWLAGLRHRRR
jgi:hypothetical protein